MGSTGTFKTTLSQTATQWADTLNPGQLEAFEQYMGNRSESISKAAAGESKSSDALAYARLINKAISEFKVSSPMTVVSGFMDGHTGLFGKAGMSFKELKALEGTSIPLTRFLSSTVNENASSTYTGLSGGIEVRTNVPAGKGIGAYLQPLESRVTEAHVAGEREFLFANKGKLYIKSVAQRSDGRILIETDYRR